jgi:hypothetical protein
MTIDVTLDHETECHSKQDIKLGDYKNVIIEAVTEDELEFYKTAMNMFFLFYKNWLVKITAVQQQEKYNEEIKEQQKQIRIERQKQVMKDLNKKFTGITI